MVPSGYVSGCKLGDGTFPVPSEDWSTRECPVLSVMGASAYNFCVDCQASHMNSSLDVSISGWFHGGPRPSKSFEALASLQSAATQVLVENGCKPATDSNPHVRGHFACEIDKHCQKVLGETYGCCCFQNILEFNAEQKTHYCATHQQQCLTKKKTLGDDKRSSAKNWNQYSAIILCYLFTLCYTGMWCASLAWPQNHQSCFQDWTSTVVVQTSALSHCIHLDILANQRPENYLIW